MMFDDNLKQQHTTLTSRKKPQNLKENDKEKKKTILNVSILQYIAFSAMLDIELVLTVDVAARFLLFWRPKRLN